MLVTKFIPITITTRNIKKYSKLFSNLEIDNIIQLPITQLSNGSHQKVDVICDECGQEKNVYYFSYNKNIT